VARAQIDGGPAGKPLFSALLGRAGLIVLRMSLVALAPLGEAAEP